MPKYALTVETTSNASTGTVAQFLMPASRDAVLRRVVIKPQQLTNTQQSGRWVIDRISAVTAGSTLVPLKMDASSVASAITDTTKSISTTLGATNTVVDSAIVELADGVNDLESLGIRAGANQGFAIRRATAPTGAQVVGITAIWDEV